ncbi:hypothetical protein BGZ46_004985 [Entomortierella lignicola]|nr:hypothetical protein BGZ46_004985 [Entomortierella lignicola]
MNISLIFRDSQQYLPGTNVSGAAAAISATTRLMALNVGAIIGDITSEFTAAEAIMTSSVGIPQCSFSTCKEYWIQNNKGLSFSHQIPALSMSKGEKLFAGLCAQNNLDTLKVIIPLPEDGTSISRAARGAIKTLKQSDTRIHVLIASRADQVELLDLIRGYGLFDKSHVWLTAIDLSDSISQLHNPTDFNGLIMTDALWNMPGVPAFDKFVNNWMVLDSKSYPHPVTNQLTWHQTFAYTCLQVIAEGYRGLVQEAYKITNTTLRNQILSEIQEGKRSQYLTLDSLASRSYDTPIGNFSINKNGEPISARISIMSFQNNTSVINGHIIDSEVSIFSPIIFKDGDTDIPHDSPSWNDVNPIRGSGFGLAMTILSGVLTLMIAITVIVVLLNRDNIIVKSASPLFCILELCGLAMTLSWIFFRGGVPTEGVCRSGLMVTVVGLTINLSALVVKNYRIYRIFNSVSIINHTVSNRYLLRVVAVPVIITTIPCLIHLFVDYPRPTLVRTNDDEYWVICSSDSSQVIWTVIILIVPALTILFGLYLAFMTRNVTRLWNEARSIAITIYMMSFFIIIIIIVQIFPDSLYQVTYHVTVACVFAGCLLEYIILFIPKLRNLWLQKQGLHVAAGRGEDMISSIISSDGTRRHSDKKYGAFDSAVGSMGLLRLGRTERASFASAADMHGNPNISDLISSYPFGQLSGENNALVTSPVHRPTDYGQSALFKRGSSKRSNNNGKNVGGIDEQDASLELEELDLSDTNRLSRRRTPSSHSGDDNTNGGGGGVSGSIKKSEEALPPKVAGYDTFGRIAHNRTSRDPQSTDLRGILKASPNRPNDTTRIQDNSSLYVGTTSAMLGSGSRRLSQDTPSHDYFTARHDIYPEFSKSYFEGYGFNRSPGLCSLQSGNHSLREMRMDSFTVTVPVQRQRWYILRILAQWRMSKIVFVPYSKLLVIVDLETGISESLILHSIEPGYSPTDYPQKSIFIDNPSTVPSKNASGLSHNENTTIEAIHPAVQGMSEVRPVNTSMFSSNKVAPERNSLWRNERNGSNTSILSDRFHSDGTLTSRQRQHSADKNADIAANELPGTTRPAHRSSISSPLTAMRHLSINFGLDFRNMDGTYDAEGGSQGLEGITNDYVVRVISIHNQCWRVQLPDQETMDRWIEIGQQIKDENWITRPIVSSKATRRDAMDRRHSTLDGGPNNCSHRPNARRGGFSLNDDNDALSYDFSKPRPRKVSISLPPTQMAPHPLQQSNESNTSPSSQHTQQFLYPPTPLQFAPFPRPQQSAPEMHSDMTVSSASSSESDHQRSRDKAAGLDQKTRSSSRFTPLRSLIRNNDDNVSNRSGMSFGSGSNFGVGVSRRLNKDNSFNVVTRTESSSSIGSSDSKKLPSPTENHKSRPRAVPIGLHISVTRSTTIDSNTNTDEDATSSANINTSNPSNTFMNSVLQNEPSTNSTSQPGAYLSISEAIISSEEFNAEAAKDNLTNIKDALAETNITYDHDQHAFHNIRKQSSTSTLTDFEIDMGAGDLIRSDTAGTSAHGVTGISGGSDKEDGIPFPQSPEWHLTSSELEKMEAETDGYNR